MRRWGRKEKLCWFCEGLEGVDDGLGVKEAGCWTAAAADMARKANGV